MACTAQRTEGLNRIISLLLMILLSTKQSSSAKLINVLSSHKRKYNQLHAVTLLTILRNLLLRHENFFNVLCHWSVSLSSSAHASSALALPDVVVSVITDTMHVYNCIHVCNYELLYLIVINYIHLVGAQFKFCSVFFFV